VGVNVAFKLVSEVSGKLLSLVLIAAVARGLGQAGFGVYVFGFTAGLILAQVCDFGMQVFVAREVAGDRPGSPGSSGISS
jgi:O-antigen/teichoic acid export membrane protein